MKFTKKCPNTQSNQNSITKLNKRRFSADRLYTSSSVSAVTSLILIATLSFLSSAFLNITGLTGTNQVHATASTLTISVTDSVALNISSLNDTGNFAHSDTSTNNVSIITNNGTGYTLGIKAKTNNSNALINSDDTSKTIPSITTSISEATYASSSSYNNTWGLRPSKLNSVVNENYIQAPTSSSTLTTLDQTSSANPSTANNYNLAIGARINSSTVPGSYSNVFVITVTVNPIPYTITYNKNTEDTVTNMPANTSSQTYDETVNISDQVPARDGFNFKGWCTVQTADGGTCSGTTYNPDGEGTALTWTLDQTVSSNSLTLYAMWAAASHCKPTGTTITTIGCMQDITSSNKSSVLSSMTQGTQYQLYDSRDDQQYWVARQADNNIWMTQNLDLDIGGTGVAALTSENTDLNTSGSAPYVDGYSTSGGVITWDPDATAKTAGRTIDGTTVTGWTSDPNAPYSAEGGDRYYYTTGTTSNETMQTLAECTAVSGRTEEDCAHYHSGNYYNWTAAIASNASSGIGSTRYDVAANSICPKGWKLPQGRIAGDSLYARQIGYLWARAGIISSSFSTRYNPNGFNNIRTSPLFFVRGGFIHGSSLYASGSYGYYWSSTVNDSTRVFDAYFSSSYIDSSSDSMTVNRIHGQSIRCMMVR